MTKNILIWISIYLKPSMTRMIILTVPTQSNCTIYTESILLIRSKIVMIITITWATIQKCSNPISILFLWWMILPNLQNPLLLFNNHKINSRTLPKNWLTIKQKTYFNNQWLKTVNFIQQKPKPNLINSKYNEKINQIFTCRLQIWYIYSSNLSWKQPIFTNKTKRLVK
jgi:hypothetical protein